MTGTAQPLCPLMLTILAARGPRSAGDVARRLTARGRRELTVQRSLGRMATRIALDAIMSEGTGARA